MRINLSLTSEQYQYISTCVAYGLNSFSPGPPQEKHSETYADLFNLTKNPMGYYEAYIEFYKR
jgi:hypothetical protein